MSKFIITGGQPLVGAVRLGGAKNASFKIMIASLLLKGRSRLLNLAKIGDVELTRQIIESLGAKTIPCGERTIFIEPNGLKEWQVPTRFGDVSRSTLLFIPPLIKHFGKAQIPFPGGDKIGQRPIERHLEGFTALGGQYQFQKNKIFLSAPQGLRGTHYRFAKNTHTGTENLIMLAILAQGKTILENAALETEIDDLIYFLNSAGAKITRLAGRKIRIIGTPEKMFGRTHAVMPDANEAASYACAALITKGDIAIEGAKKKDLAILLEKISQAGGAFKIYSWGIRFWWKGDLRAVNVTTRPFPGFKTDWQPLWTSLATQMVGTSQITETIYEDRFGFVDPLKKMGAKIKFFQPKVVNPEKFYNFNYQEADPRFYHGIKVTGPTPLHGAHFQAVDLRHGATLTIAALAAQGTSQIDNAQVIDRGYEDLGLKLKELGGNIKIINND
ncbi:MAG: UDP-N-acetylglucosamine 1-carboxyvinyltransferase [Candidatus Shapirobacteria bacterium]|nr:UDP-N-acetylglucosamine 1-carboxyvinyltransferase [Candidatus Shapirobacteria bacterium]MDD5073967.1 UDP-N-acetylglucosamine 1-carboxyvinyltransferase [Candidatus Shapirobacteria bacterium]MDD5481675.1 UDP-N-acetylglucosamine 1-carboxyvinyltransferase [Candidatus Shapirobacteria bacterium]